MAKSIVQNNKECFLCGTNKDLEKHHLLMGAKHRSLADEDGLWIWLCHFHHTGSKTESAHFNEMFRRQFQKKAQIAYEKHIGTREQFIERYGENYL